MTMITAAPRAMALVAITISSSDSLAGGHFDGVGLKVSAGAGAGALWQLGRRHHVFGPPASASRW